MSKERKESQGSNTITQRKGQTRNSESLLCFLHIWNMGEKTTSQKNGGENVHWSHEREAKTERQF